MYGAGVLSIFPAQESSVRKVRSSIFDLVPDRPGSGLRDEITRFSLWTGIGFYRSREAGLFENEKKADLTAESARSREAGSEREYG